MISIAVFRKDNLSYKKYIFEKVTVHISKGVKIEDTGFTKDDKCIIRIFDIENENIFPEDKIEIGLGGIYPTEDALTVICVTDNRRGTNPHIKVECI